jgi:1,4-dihydroxy-2-naphthoyl-CoA hydrolase
MVRGVTAPDFPDYDQSVADGLLAANPEGDPGLMGFLGIRHTGCGPGWIAARVDVRPDLITFVGTMHGGVVSALTDHVLGSVMYPIMPKGSWAATTEFKVNLTRPVRGGVLEARAEVIALGRRTGVVRIDITNTDDGAARLCAAAQGTVSIQAPKS